MVEKAESFSLKPNTVSPSIFQLSLVASSCFVPRFHSVEQDLRRVFENHLIPFHQFLNIGNINTVLIVFWQD